MPKVAGQSIEAALRSAVPEAGGARDDMALRKRGRDEPGPERLAHLTGTDYTALGFVSHAEYSEFFKFAFVRDPCDRAFSLYRHFGFEEYLSFEYFLDRVLKRELWSKKYWFVRPQCDFVLDANGELCVDFLGRFETLDQDFAHVAGVLGLPDEKLAHINRAGSSRRLRKLRALKRYPRILAHLRGMMRRPRNAGRGNYSAEALGIIDELYRCDIVRFEYALRPLREDDDN